jgi:ParB-like chromosome segregation protein Spo0J
VPADKIPSAFRGDPFLVPVDKLFPLRALAKDIHTTLKYKRILASARELGIIEALNVYPQKGAPGTYVVLDGNVRLDVAKRLGEREVLCLLATEDETYTYNQKINVMTPIQEHFMIRKAIKNGVSEERIARTLNINVSRVREKRNLLAGICPEVVAMIKDRRISAAALREFKRVAPLRQMEMAELMIGMKNFSLSYAKSLYVGSREEHKLENEKPKGNHGVSAEESGRMRNELDNLGREFRAMQDNFGETVLSLVPIRGYLRSLLANSRVQRFLAQRYGDFLTEFQRIAESQELETAA